MRVLTWAHKRHRLLNALTALDSNVAARAALLRENWATAPDLADATPGTSASPAQTLTRSLSPALARAAATVEATRVASEAPAKPMRGEHAPAKPAPAKSSPSIPGIAPGEPVPAYLQ